MAAILDLIIRRGSWNIKYIVIEFVLIDFVEKMCYMEDGSFFLMLRTTWILNDRHLGFHRQLTFNKHFNELVKIDLVENEVLHNKIGFVFQKLKINQIQNWPPAIILHFNFLHIFSSLFTRLSPLDKNIICWPF